MEGAGSTPTCGSGCQLLGEEGAEKKTHDEVARVGEEQLADLEAFWTEVRVEAGGELEVTRGFLCGSPRGEGSWVLKMRRRKVGDR